MPALPRDPTPNPNTPHSTRSARPRSACPRSRLLPLLFLRLCCCLRLRRQYKPGQGHLVRLHTFRQHLIQREHTGQFDTIRAIAQGVFPWPVPQRLGQLCALSLSRFSHVGGPAEQDRPLQHDCHAQSKAPPYLGRQPCDAALGPAVHIQLVLHGLQPRPRVRGVHVRLRRVGQERGAHVRWVE